MIVAISTQEYERFNSQQDARHGGQIWREQQPTNIGRDSGVVEVDRMTLTEQSEITGKHLWGAIAEASAILDRITGGQPEPSRDDGAAIGKGAGLADLQRSNAILAHRLLLQLLAIRERL